MSVFTPTINVTTDGRKVWVNISDPKGMLDCTGARFCQISGEVFFDRRSDMSHLITCDNETWKHWKDRVFHYTGVHLDERLEPDWSKKARETGLH